MCSRHCGLLPNKHKGVHATGSTPATLAKLRFPAKTIAGIPVVHVAWRDLFRWLRSASRKAGRMERPILADLAKYFGEIMKIQKKDSSLAYVVALSKDTPQGWGLSWIEVVTKKHVYFHPIAPTWPKEPPAYMAFRFDGMLQSIHYVKDYSVITDHHQACAELPRGEVKPRFLYKLGPAIRPDRHVRTGGLYRNARVLCAIDLLLTSRTIAEARALTKKRFAEE